MGVALQDCAVVTRFDIALASGDDDAQLRARMAQDCMQGAIAVSFRREPSYFLGCRVQGERTQVVKCTDRSSGTIIGLGSRSQSDAWVDGERRRIGYLADLRLAPEHRGGLLLARGYRFFRDLHRIDPLPFYVTVIYEGNTPALHTLTSGRAGLPLYRDWGRLLTPAIRLDLRLRPHAAAEIRIERGRPEQIAAIVAFLNRCLRARQFAPCYREEDFVRGRFAGLSARDFFIARRHDRIVGTAAVWDQCALRQTHVERYSGIARWARPVYNALARVSARKPLPDPGARIPMVYIACLAVEDDDAALLRHLLRAVHEHCRQGPWHFAIAGLHEADPLAPVLAEFKSIPASGRVFVVHFPEEEPAIDGPDRRVPYLEAGCL